MVSEQMKSEKSQAESCTHKETDRTLVPKLVFHGKREIDQECYQEDDSNQTPNGPLGFDKYAVIRYQWNLFAIADFNTIGEVMCGL